MRKIKLKIALNEILTLRVCMSISNEVMIAVDNLWKVL